MTQDLVMTGYMGLAGTERLIALERVRLARRFPVGFLEQAADRYHRQQGHSGYLRQRFGLAQASEARLSEADGIAGVWESSRQGFLQALWDMSRAWETGFTVQLKEVPVRQETIEICEILEVNPYELDSEGCLWIAAQNGYRLCRQLQRQGISAAIIGELTDSKDCLLIHDDTVSYLNRPREEAFSRYRREQADAAWSNDDEAGK